VVGIAAGAGEAEHIVILRRQRSQFGQHLPFTEAGIQPIEAAVVQVRRNFVEQRIDAVDTDGGEHLRHFGFGMGDEGHGVDCSEGGGEGGVSFVCDERRNALRIGCLEMFWEVHAN